MNPQPPVTKMRIGALPTSGAEPARGEIEAPPPRFDERLRQVDWIFWGIIAGGALLRFLFLSMKPPHFDEGINGWFVDQMMKNGFYRYDPTNYHGPLHFYILFLAQALFGRHIWALRLPVVLASIGSIFVTLKFEPLVGRRVSRMAALAMAVSPGFIFYGRYSIHEVWLLLFSMIFVLGLLGLWRFGTRGYLWCVGFGVAGMILTKETYIIHIGCAFIAAGVLWVSHRITPMPEVKRARQQWDWADLAMVAGVGIFLVVFFYSGTFLNWTGLKGLYQTFAVWYQTGSKGNGHEKPWPYWLELTLRYEWPVFIGLLLCLVCQFFESYVIRYLAIYGVGIFTAYSIIHYKTPWIIISIAWPLLFVFAAGAVALKIPRKAFYIVGLALAGFLLGAVLSYVIQNGMVREHCSWGSYLSESVKVTLAGSSTSPVCGEIGWRLYGCAIVVALLGGGLGLWLGQSSKLSEEVMRGAQRGAVALALLMSLGVAISLNYFHCSTETEPYVYVQTYNDIYKLMKPVMRLVRSNPLNYRMTGHLIRTSTYPFPWLLGDFPNVGYYEQNNSPGKLDGDFLVVQSDRVAEVEKKLHENYFTEPMTIRPYQDPSKLYLNAKTFRRLFPGKAPDFVGTPAPSSRPAEMKWFSAGLTFVNVATIAGLILGILGGGLDAGFAGLALLLGLAAAIWAWIGTSHFSRRKKKVVVPSPVPLPKSKRARRRMKLAPEPVEAPPPPRRWHFWAWAVGLVFAMFAVRSFCWLLWIDGDHLKIQSPYNLGDLSLHITFIKYFANGVPLWPDNPIYVFSRLRYPAGIDFFDSLLLLQHVDLIRALVWTGLLGSAATFYGFYRWGGAFGVAGFLFNGGLSGYEFFRTHEFIDYQGDRIAWKSIPLTMFVTQRGLLYAIPAGLLLLLHWRRKYYPRPGDESLPGRRGLLPWWVEWSLYATMPFYHVHTFLALSGLLAFWLVIGSWEMRREIALLLAAAFLPATWIVWMITDHFKAKSILEWAPGWLQSDPGFSNSAIKFWLVNFGLTLPAMIALVGLVVWRVWQARFPKPVPSPNPDPALTPVPEHDVEPATTSENETGNWQDVVRSPAFAFVIPAAGIFLFALFVKTAPWGWDNTKLIIWAYFICLPFLWRDLIAKWPIPVRAGICFLLFASGFVSLFGGLGVGGFDLATRTELNAVETVLRKLPIKDRFACFPTYNHPLLLNGRKAVLGYPGHLWTQGFSDYGALENQLGPLMLGAPDWRERARALQARYLFWGNEEKRAYASSSQPWRGKAKVVATGFWGTIYDLQHAAPGAGQ